MYVTLQHHGLGIAECLRSMRVVYRRELNEGLLLRALSYLGVRLRPRRPPLKMPLKSEDVTLARPAPVPIDVMQRIHRWTD
jgi:hypothetical protein